MSNMNNLIKSSFAMMLENVPYVGKMFQVMKEMEHRQNFEKLILKQEINSKHIQSLLNAVDKIEQNVDTNDGIREIKEFRKHHGFVMLPKILHKDPHFEDFWKSPQDYGGAREPLDQAESKDGVMSFLMFDMYGDQWVYHIPINTFGMMLQNRSLKGLREDKVIGVDAQTDSFWITAQNQDIYNAKIPLLGRQNQHVISPKPEVAMKQNAVPQPKKPRRIIRYVFLFLFLLAGIALIAGMVFTSQKRMHRVSDDLGKFFVGWAVVFSLFLCIFFRRTKKTTDLSPESDNSEKTSPFVRFGCLGVSISFVIIGFIAKEMVMVLFALFFLVLTVTSS